MDPVRGPAPLIDLRAGKPEIAWPGSDKMIDNVLVYLGPGRRVEDKPVP
jgi:hypothetical protein